ncbi:Asp-tRNA(Asn)/Glu-tRNA(Gln) amidotransferase subunit GatA [Paludicola sp. MB14-C6]|uniref:Asp-tRNA(Asn)/Glu-tRNA(Gln) amidotransferase subunit GatA n=1 Tax=Paludihabitans sp. MB14-C6 TaxID=3070656 RepID=UPI0027DE4864|nr:Asp-tRNA(Asn)/Glu-tRNA(Gln) amidotransferase subunit GatA [Paludicola sp. MB14-C6]WMJ23367.1 Asp-tRNA(Asn)/Glu-tRNA(Gln) amidotransferase subunit GatA [Paludicola sp. MB14-C6]
MELYKLTATELSNMLRNKECSSVEITKSVIDRITNVENKVNAYITVTNELAIEQAKSVDEKLAKGNKLSPLAGIPVGIKDNICTKDVLTTCASKILYNFVPPYNATVYNRLLDNDVVLTGKLNLDEFAMGSSCENSYFKKTSNPHNLEYVPGGSSGGSAAAVAAGEAILTLGSDTGGSIRLPAAYCGVVGLKPTYGSVSRYGLVAFASSLDQIGPFARSINDTAMIYSAICGADKMDATSAKREYPNFVANLNTNIKGLRIGLPKEYFAEGVSEEVKQNVMEAAKLLEQNGAVLVPVSLPSTDYALSAYYIISSAEASSNLARFDGVKYGYRTENYNNLIEMYENTRSEGFGDEVKRRILLGTFVLSSGYYDAYYKRAKLLQKQILNEFNETFEQCDVLLTPTGTDTAFKIGEKSNDPIKMYANDICTVTVNIAGLPAISIPCGKAKNGLPIGMQFIGPKFSEQSLFNVSKKYEDLVGGFNDVPTL